MKKTFFDLIKLLFPLRGEKHRAMELARSYLREDEARYLTQALKLDWCFPVMQSFHTSNLSDAEWPFFKTHRKDEELHAILARINDAVSGGARAQAFTRFAPDALTKIRALVAPNILGHEALKEASALQLFATPSEAVHLLFLGDPGTGKTDLLRSIQQLSPKSSMGLGSGTSGAGLSAMAKGDTLLLGLLPLADEGIACIDELNLMKARDMAALYNAMEKGFVAYDKGSKHEQLPARVRVIATANPTGDTFIGKGAEALRRQVPFADALLSRFHLVFLVRKPTTEEFGHIAQHIVKHASSGTAAPTAKVRPEDAAFVKEYVAYASGVDVTVDPEFEQRIVHFVKELKSDERKFLVDIGPRTVVGIVRIVKAVARAHLATSVTSEHVDRACALLRTALYVREPDVKEDDVNEQNIKERVRSQTSRDKSAESRSRATYGEEQ